MTENIDLNFFTGTAVIIVGHRVLCTPGHVGYNDAKPRVVIFI